MGEPPIKRFKEWTEWTKGGRRMAETEQGKAGNLQAFHEGLQKGKNNNNFNAGMERGMEKGYDKGHMEGHAQGLIAGKSLQLQTIRNVVSQAVNDSVTGFIMSEVGLQAYRLKLL